MGGRELPHGTASTKTFLVSGSAVSRVVVLHRPRREAPRRTHQNSVEFRRKTKRGVKTGKVLQGTRGCQRGAKHLPRRKARFEILELVTTRGREGVFNTLPSRYLKEAK